MYTVGLDCDTIVSLYIEIYTNIIELYAEKFNNYLDPLGCFIPLGKILNNKQSAGNLYKNCLIDIEEKIEIISDHLLKHKYPQNDIEFGYYLAGLIEGDGNFGKDRLEIIFHENDISLAYYIKKRIGYGNIYKFLCEDKKTYKYSLDHIIGLKKVLELINGKFLTKNKFEQLKKHSYDIKFNTFIIPPSNFSLLNNH
jgi:hypothetical protein